MMKLSDHAMYSKFPANPGYHMEVDGTKNTYFLRVCIIPKGGRIRGHQCLGENRVQDFDGFFKQNDIIRHIDETRMEPLTVSFDEIWHQIHRINEKEKIIQSDARYQQADVSFPGILAPVRNPVNKPYRLLDGRRRMWKQQEEGKTEGLFYVIPEDEIFQFFWIVLPMDVAREHLDEMQNLVSQSLK
ncbi:MAG: hypothetical protein ACI9R7_001345 [Lysobacterales bacterium]|jgi:hypothetical protein